MSTHPSREGGDPPVPDTHFPGDLSIDHVRFYVEDLRAQVEDLRHGFGFGVYARSDPAASGVDSVLVGAGDIRLLLTQVDVDDHPGRGFVAAHGDGVADIALRTPDAAAAFEAAVSRGARPVAELATADGVTTAAILGFGDVVHTFVQRPDAGPALPGLRPVPGEASTGSRLGRIDHLAVCLEAGRLEPTTRYYETALDFREIFTERIRVGGQAMNSAVVQDRSGRVTLTLLEPDPSRDPGQLDDFLKDHGGPGVQHVALTADDIVRTVGALGERGTEFLPTPDAYYDDLPRRLPRLSYPVRTLRDLDILVDSDHDGQLYQIFCRSTHPRHTYFFEIIERFGARTFGSGNIQALYEAVERDHAPQGR